MDENWSHSVRLLHQPPIHGFRVKEASLHNGRITSYLTPPALIPKNPSPQTYKISYGEDSILGDAGEVCNVSMTGLLLNSASLHALS